MNEVWEINVAKLRNYKLTNQESVNQSNGLRLHINSGRIHAMAKVHNYFSAVCAFVHSFPTSCPTVCSLPGCSSMEFSSQGILVWTAISSSRKSSQSRNQACFSCIPCIGWQVLCYSYLLLHNKLSKAWRFKRANILPLFLQVETTKGSAEIF